MQLARSEWRSQCKDTMQLMHLDAIWEPCRPVRSRAFHEVPDVERSVPEPRAARAALTEVPDFAHALMRPVLSILEENDRDSRNCFLA